MLFGGIGLLVGRCELLFNAVLLILDQLLFICHVILYFWMPRALTQALVLPAPKAGSVTAMAVFTADAGWGG